MTRAAAPRPRRSLADLSRAATLPSAGAFQRDAARRLDALAAAAGRGASLRIGHVRVDALDLVRHDLLRAGGEALGFVALLAHAPPGATVTTPVASIALEQAATAWRHVGRDVQVEPTTVGARAREHAFVAREQARAVRAGGLDVGAGAGRGYDVLVTAQLPGHVGDVEPVVRRLVDDGCAVGFLVADARAAGAVRAAGFEVAGPRVHPAGDVAKVLAATVALRARVAWAARRTARDANGRAFAAAVARILELQLHQAVVFATGCAPVLAGPTTAALLTPNASTWAGRTAGRLALATGRTVVGIEHGSVFPDDPRWAGLPVTAMGAWGEPSRRAFISSGLPADRVVVTGAPRFDRPATVDPVPRGDGPARVLVATSGAGDHVSLDAHLRFVDVLAGALAAGPPARWTVKLHPKDRVERYADLVAAPPAHASVSVVGGDHASRSSIFDFLADADVLVTVSSTTALDALRAGVPVVVVDVAAGAEPLPEFVARAAAVVVHDDAGLAAAVRDAARGALAPADPAYLAEHVDPGGDATGRVIDLLGLPSAGRRGRGPATAPRP